MELTQFNPYQLLTELSSSQATGVLKTTNGHAVWHIYLNAGETEICRLFSSDSIPAQLFFVPTRISTSL